MKLTKTFALLLFVGFATNIIAQKTITPEYIADMKSVRTAHISPDGEYVAYTVRVPHGKGSKPGASDTELWVKLNTKDGKAIKYIGKPNSVNSVSWGKNGNYIYFTASRKDASKYNQVYRISIKGGEAEQVTDLEDRSVGSYKLSPDGKHIGFTAREPQSKEEKADAEIGKDWIVYGENHKMTQLHVMELATKKVNHVKTGNLNITDFSWAPNNKTLVFMASATPEIDQIYMFQKIYKISDGDAKPTVLTETKGKLGNIEISPDGKWAAFAGAVDITDPLPQSLFVVSMDGSSAPKNLTVDYKGSVTHVDWLDSKTILMQSVEGSISALNKVNAADGKRTAIPLGEKITRSISIDKKSGKIATVASTPTHPNEVYLGDLKKGNLIQLTNHFPNLKDMKLGKQEIITWKGPDDWDIEGILTYPLNYKEGQQYPLLLQIHGGPEGVSTNGWNTRPVYPVQWYAANGYFVLEPNYRGSQGKGVTFSKGDHKDLAGKEFEDVLAGIDYLIEKKMVDANKVGTGGFSYGGYFSAWAATKHSDRFKAAMMGAGIANWISFSGTTDIIYENSHVHWNLWWYDEMELVWDRSPLAHINNAKTPTLIVHGEKDDRVPLSQGQELYNALQLKGVPSQLVVYKRQPHGILEREAQIDFMNRTLDWYNKYIEPTK